MGLNYEIECDTKAGKLTLSIFSQPWTKTFHLTRAHVTYAESGSSSHLAGVKYPLLEQPFKMDAVAFKEFDASQHSNEDL